MGERACCSAKVGQTAPDFPRPVDFPPTTYRSGTHGPPVPPMRTLLSLLLTPSEKYRYVTFQDGFEEFSGGLMGRFSHTKFICETEEKDTFTVARFGVKSTAAYK